MLKIDNGTNQKEWKWVLQKISQSNIDYYIMHIMYYYFINGLKYLPISTYKKWTP